MSLYSRADILVYPCVPELTCPTQKGYRHYEATGVCLKIVTDVKRSLDDARTFCELEGGHLFDFNTEQEFDNLNDSLSGKYHVVPQYQVSSVSASAAANMGYLALRPCASVEEGTSRHLNVVCSLTAWTLARSLRSSVKAVTHTHTHTHTHTYTHTHHTHTHTHTHTRTTRTFASSNYLQV